MLEKGNCLPAPLKPGQDRTKAKPPYTTMWHNIQPQQGLPCLLQPLQVQFSQFHKILENSGSAGTPYR